MATKGVAVLGKKVTSECVQNFFPEEVSTIFFDYHEKISLEKKVIFIFLLCDFKCGLTECSEKFAFAYKHREIPFAIVKLLLLYRNPLSLPIFALSFFETYDLSPAQRSLVDGMKCSEYYAGNLRLKFHVSDVLYKIAALEKEIAERPDELFDLKKSAQSIGLSPSWLSRRFRELSGLTLEKFIIKNRLCFALWQIISTDKMIKEIFYGLGYQPFSFYKRYKEEFGVAPTFLRKNLITTRPAENISEAPDE